MSKDNKCKCTLAQSLVGDGCRYCQPQDYIDRLRDEIKDMQKDYDKLFNEKATVYHLTADALLQNKSADSWQGLSYDEIEAIKEKCTTTHPDGKKFNSFNFGRAIEQALRSKNDY